MDDNARYIVAIAEAHSISAAARKLNLSQPALSQRLKHLEARLGTELFDRQTAHLTPTYAGQTYLRWARQAVIAEEETCRKIAAIASKGRRRLQVGTSLPRGSCMFVDVVSRFSREVPSCTLFFSEAGMPDSHETKLNEGQIDCAVLTPVHPKPPFVRGEVLCHERMVVMAPSDMAFESRDQGGPYRTIDANDLSNAPFIMPPHNLKHNWVIRHMMDVAGVRIQVALHSCSNEMTVSLVRRGLGVSIVPNTFTYGWSPEGLSYYEVEGFPYLSDLYYNRRAGLEPTADELQFVAMLKEWISQHPELA